jgi:hypothetical protein
MIYSSHVVLYSVFLTFAMVIFDRDCKFPNDFPLIVDFLYSVRVSCCFPDACRPLSICRMKHRLFCTSFLKFIKKEEIPTS